MNILITGASGFIGRSLKNSLSSTYTVFSLVRDKQDEAFGNAIVLDLADSISVKQSLTSGKLPAKVDVVIHCAAQLSDSNNKYDISVYKTNNIITENVISMCENLKPTKLINFSTIGVYANRDGKYGEESAVNPSTNNEGLYGLSKFCSEELFWFYLHEKMEVINLRLCQAYGEGMRKDRIYSIMLDELKKDNSITVFGNGERVSGFITIEFLIQTIDKILAKKNMSGLYNMGERNMSYTELAEGIIKKYGNRSSTIAYKEEGSRSKVEIDFSKLKKALS
jgi:nucleoside-diphosphate-sugar epimerase